MTGSQMSAAYKSAGEIKMSDCEITGFVIFDSLVRDNGEYSC